MRKFLDCVIEIMGIGEVFAMVIAMVLDYVEILDSITAVMIPCWGLLVFLPVGTICVCIEEYLDDKEWKRRKEEYEKEV